MCWWIYALQAYLAALLTVCVCARVFVCVYFKDGVSQDLSCILTPPPFTTQRQQLAFVSCHMTFQEGLWDCEPQTLFSGPVPDMLGHRNTGINPTNLAQTWLSGKQT